MKHIKIFENFDRYDFGHYNDLNSNNDKLNYVVDHCINLDKNESSIIQEKLSSYKVNLDIYKKRIDILVGDYTDIRKLTFYHIYSLGDYSYALVYTKPHRYVDLWEDTYEPNEDGDPIDIWIIDQFDNLIKQLQNIKINNQINENISRYDYGLYYSSDVIDDFYDLVHNEKNPFSDKESDILYQLLDGKVDMLDLHQDVGVVYFEYNKLLYSIQYLGDYCYVIFVDNGINTNGWISCEIIDEFDNLCDSVKKIITKEISK